MDNSKLHSYFPYFSERHIDARETVSSSGQPAAGFTPPGRTAPFPPNKGKAVARLSTAPRSGCLPLPLPSHTRSRSTLVGPSYEPEGGHGSRSRQPTHEGKLQKKEDDPSAILNKTKFQMELLPYAPYGYAGCQVDKGDVQSSLRILGESEG